VRDNHSAHVSRETRAYLTSVPNRFEFVFTPKHGSWLNLVESFFGKLARTLLRGIRVTSKQELRARIELYLKEVNEEPTVFKWKYKLEALATESTEGREEIHDRFVSSRSVCQRRDVLSESVSEMEHDRSLRGLLASAWEARRGRAVL
jgi:DDE superfamily endonuclease